MQIAITAMGEKDDEIKGEANSVDYGTRIYDPRVGKFLSVDPRQLEFPFMSPFIYADDDPIRMIDEMEKDRETELNSRGAFTSKG